MYLLHKSLDTFYALLYRYSIESRTTDLLSCGSSCLISRTLPRRCLGFNFCLSLSLRFRLPEPWLLSRGVVAYYEPVPLQL